MSADPSPVPQEPPTPSHGPVPRHWAGRIVRVVAWLTLGLLLTTLLVAGGGAAALWRQDGVQAWVLGHLPGVRVSGAQGNVWGDFRATRVEVDLPRGGMASVEGVAWQGLRLKWARQAAWQLGVSVSALRARRLDVRWVANPQPSSGPPQDVASPVAVQIDRLQLGEAHSPWWGDQALRQLDARVVVQGWIDGQARHAVQVKGLSWQGWGLRGDLSLGVSQGLALQAKVHGQGTLARPQPGGPADEAPLKLWAQAQAQGRLSDLQASLNVGTQPVQDDGPAGRPGVSAAIAAPNGMVLTGTGHGAGVMGLNAQAHVQPFASWPVLALDVSAQALDVSRLWPTGPRTQLAGELTLRPDGPQALQARWRWRNALAGPWDAARLPLAQTEGQVRWPKAFAQGRLLSQPWLQGELDVRVEGPAQAGGAGQLRAQGGWGGQQPLVLSWLRLWLPTWDRRAPPLSFASGELRLAPEWQLGAGAPVLSAAAPAATATSAALAAQGAPRGRWALQTRGEVITSPLDALPAPGAASAPGAATSALAGPPPGTSRKPVAVDGRGTWAMSGTGGSLTLDRLSLVSASAQALLQAVRMGWTPQGVQALEGQAQLQAFDPAVWLPWPTGMGGRNALSGQGRLRLNAQAEGEARFTLQPSVLAGVPLQGEASWLTTAPRPSASPLQTTLDVALDAGGNRISLATRWPRQVGQPAWPQTAATWLGMQSRLQVEAPDLAALKPMLPLLQLQALQGALRLQAQVQGAWPQLSTTGDWHAQALRVQALQGPAVSMAQAQGRWQWDGRQPLSPAAVHADIQQAEVLGWQIPQVQAHLEGLLREHRISLQVQAVVPGKGTGTDAGKGPGMRMWAGQTLSLSTQGQGQWLGAGGGAVGDLADAIKAVQANWQGQLQQLRINREAAGQAPAPSSGPAVSATPDDPLLELDPTTLRWVRDASGQQWALSPTAMRALGVRLKLDTFTWRLPTQAGASGGERLRASAHIEPLDVVAQLQRWQPDAGWGGKLMLDGQVQLSQDALGEWRVAADLGRQSGDLTLREPTIEGSQAQALGIRDTRIQLRAEGGVWHLSQRFDGALLGRFEGEQTVRTARPSDLPGPKDALQGKLLLSAPNLRPWGTWMPPGWRLTGEAQAQAVLGGTLGAPTYEGQIEARHLGLTQALMGVQLREGELSVRLAGDKLTLTRFQAWSGDVAKPGSVSATGEAQVLAPAQATLRLRADRFAVLQRVDRRLLLSGDAQLQFTPDLLAVEGALKVDEGLFDISRSDAPTVGDDVNVLDPNRDGDDDAGVATSSRKTQIKVDIDLGQRLRIQGRGLEATLTGKLRAGMAANKPTLNGTVGVEQGRYAAYGQKLVVERSTVVFTGAVDNPKLDILAMRQQLGKATDSDVKVGVSITGTAQDPRVRLYSDPELSETEKLSWLVLGRAPSGLGTADIGLLQSAAVALLSGEGKSTSDNLIGALGLDELSVHQSDGTVKETVVNVGKQVSRYWYVGYERNLAATSGSWQLVYRLAQRFMVRLQAGEANALDFIWSWRWD